MSIAIIVLSLLVFLLCSALLLCAFKLFDLNAQVQLYTKLLLDKEELICRANNLVHEKFGYYVPMSDKYISIEEIMHDKAKRQEGEK